MNKDRNNARLGLAWVLFGAGALSAVTSVPGFAQEEDDGSAAFDGQWTYEVKCAGCHGDDGQGIYAFGNNLRDNPFVTNAPEEAIISVINEGRYNRGRAYPEYPGMPAFDGIRAGQAHALVDYLKEGLQQEE